MLDDSEARSQVNNTINELVITMKFTFLAPGKKSVPSKTPVKLDTVS